MKDKNKVIDKETQSIIDECVNEHYYIDSDEDIRSVVERAVLKAQEHERRKIFREKS